MANYVLDHTGQQVNTKLTKAENIDNKVTSLSSSSTNTQYPSAKAVYDQLALKGNAKIYYGTCSTAADVAEKQVVCSAYTNTGDPVKGDIIYVTFDNTNIVSSSSLTLKVGNSIAKGMKYQGLTSLSNLPGSGVLISNNTYRFVYNGTYWVVTLNYDSNTIVRTYASNTDIELPIISVNGADSATATALSWQGSGENIFSSSYGAIPATSNLRPTINQSTGKLTIPGGVQIGAPNALSSTYTTTISGTAEINRLEIAEDIIPANEGCKLGDDGWEWDVIYSLNYIGSAQLNGTPTAPTAAAGTNTTQIATTAFVQSAVSDKQKQHITTSVTLPATNWSNHSITVTVNGVTSTNTVMVTFVPSSVSTVSTSEVYCASQNTNSLTFECYGSMPLEDITANILILPD